MDEHCYVEPISIKASTEQPHKADRALLTISGMGCENCVTRVRNSLLSLSGVYAADVLLKLGIAEILFDGAMVSPAVLIAAVARAGNDGRHNYRAEVIAA